MSMKNFSDTIGNRTRDLSGCSTVPQPTTPPRAPPVIHKNEGVCGEANWFVIETYMNRNVVLLK